MSLLIVLASLALALAAPSATLLISPLALGMPHLAADAWCLFSRAPRRLAPAFLLWALPPLAVIALRRAAGLAPWPSLDMLLGASAVLAAALTADAPWPRRAACAAAAAALGAGGALHPAWATSFLAQGHNLFAAAFWLWLARPLSRADKAAALAFAVGFGALATGALAPLSGTGAFAGFTPAALSAALAPGLAPEAAWRFAWVFAFAQMVHYGAWLILLPAALARGSWRAELSALLARPWALPAAAACLAVAGAGLASPISTRGAFLSIAGGHAWLELAALTQFVLHGQRMTAISPRRLVPEASVARNR